MGLGCEVGVGGVIRHSVVSMKAVCFPPTPSPPLALPVGLKRSMVLTGKEKEKKNRGALSWLVRANNENVWMVKRKWIEC